MKANCGDHIDRISNLPSNVIDDILQHLSIQDVIQTSVLSRKWRFMWVSVPRLEFGLYFFDFCYGRNLEDQIPSIVTEILLLHKGPISKFTLTVPFWNPGEITRLSKWILFLSRSDIKYLDLSNYSNSEHFEMPSHLFSCQGLTYLKLNKFKLSLPPNFCGFKCLLELRLIDIRFESGALERLISSCPVVKVLTISLCSGFDSIHVSTPSLKVLCIGDQHIKSIGFKKANNLTDLALFMENDLENWENFEQVSVSDFIKGLPKIQRLCLRGEYYIKMLSTDINMQTLRKSISIKYLELDGLNFDLSREDLSFVSLELIRVELVMKEPELVIKSSCEAPLPDYLREIYCNRCCLSQLQKVNITIGSACEHEHVLDLIRFLLANSSSLEMLTFKTGIGRKRSDTPTLLSISRDLLQMRRASQTAEVKFLHDGLTE